MPTSLLELLLPPRRQRQNVLRRLERGRGGALPAGELRRWYELWDRLAIERLGSPGKGGAAAPCGELELAKPNIARPSLAKLLEGVHVERIQAYLCGCEILGRKGDIFFAASCEPAKNGASPVYYIHDDDWGLHPEAPSIAAWLFDALDAEHLEGALGAKQLASYQRRRRAFDGVSPKAIEPAADPEQLFERSEWLLDWFLFAFSGYQVRRWDERLTAAAPFAAFASERSKLRERPDLALYWLWAHLLLDNARALASTVTALAGHPDPAVRESLSLVKALGTAKANRKLAARVAEFREQIAPADAPEAVFEPGRRAARAKAQRAAERAAPADEQSAMRALKRAAKADASVAEALRLLGDFDAGKHVEDRVDWRMFMPQRRFGELIDERFAPLLVGRIRRGAGHADDKRAATRGMIYGWGKVAGSFAAFTAVIDEVGVDNLGPARLEELYRAWGELDDEAASARLVEAAERFLGDRADRTHREAFRRLLRATAGSQAIAEVERLILSYLSSTDLAAETVDRLLCTEVIFAAARLRLAAASDEIKRLIAAGLGTLSSGEQIYRGRLLRALFHAGGGDGYAFIRGIYARYVATSGAEKLAPLTDSWSAYYHELACLIAAMHMMRPGDEWARSLFIDAWHRYALLSATVNQFDYVGMIALLRAVEEAGLDGYEEMLLAFAEHRIEPRYAHQERWGNSVREIASHLCRSTPGCASPGPSSSVL